MTRGRIWGCLWALICLVPAGAQSLPEGKGRAQFERICSRCHGLQIVTKMRQSSDAWAAVVDDMVSRGAEGTDDELDLIVRYLSTNFGRTAGDTASKDTAGQKVNINTASAAALASELGLSAADADAIVRYRKDNGDFKDWPDLRKVPAIDFKRLEDQKTRVVFAGTAETPK